MASVRTSFGNLFQFGTFVTLGFLIVIGVILPLGVLAVLCCPTLAVFGKFSTSPSATPC